MKLEPSLTTLQAQIELRVLLGSQAGSRLILSPMQYNLGSGDDCDVILSGPKMEEMHACLNFDGEQVTIRTIAGKISDAHGNEITEEYPLAYGAPIEIGGIWISVDKSDADWPDPADVVPIMPAPPSPALPDKTHVSGEIGNTEPPLDNQKKFRARKLLIAASAALGLIALTGIILAAWLINDATPQPSPGSTSLPQTPLADPPNLAKVREVLTTGAPGSSIYISITGSRQIIVKGFVPDSASKASLLASLEILNPPPKVTLLVDAEIAELASKLLSEKLDISKAKLSVDGVHGGQLTLQGAVATQGVRDSVIDMLQAEISGLRSISISSLVLADDLPQLLQDQLASADLLKKIQIMERQPEFTMRGTLTEEEMLRWESLIVDFTVRFGKLLPIRATMSVATTTPPLQVQTIIGGSSPFVMTNDGERGMRGGEGKGNKLVIVKDSEIIFEGKERFKISR